ncbi:neutrophil cytosol factor 1-like isoform X2 [Xyrauchen texanus]|uniref:neutrophil cytosol factor 1-like isoform X2 n=1 Tax=Xyrauchen texanus TaxID=154827 RepID=UPI002241BCAD|nr:neutrophil cytosol factor 1-like isoform X2 [Xyrauchen texanus]
MAETYVLLVELLGFEKRFFPSQHYVYMLLVKWSDQSEKLIYRRYPEIHTFHALKEMFPIEAGDIDEKDRIIPSLLAPKWLDNQKTTETRQGTLAEYCRALLNLPPNISGCHLVLDFFKMRLEDESPPAPHPYKRNETFMSTNRSRFNTSSEITGPIMLESYRVITDYSKSSKYEITLSAGDMVDIVEKSLNGWWFCQCEYKRGWFPASYLEPLDGADELEEPEPNYVGELYKTTNAYTAVEEDELTLEAGETIEVIHKLLDGWWVVRNGEDTGYYPSMFLSRAGEQKEVDAEKDVVRRSTPPPRRSTIPNAQSIHTKGRQQISLDIYRKQSRRFLQQRRSLNSPLQERKTNTENVAKTDSFKAEDLDQNTPVIPPRPSPQLILERCTENTCKRVSIHEGN